MKKNTKYLFIILTALGTILLSIYGLSYAKYVNDSIWNYYLDSKGFYLNSKYLDTTIVKNVNNLWDGNSVHFSVENNLNDSVITPFDINFNVSCEVLNNDNADCTMNNKSTNIDTGTITYINGEISSNDLYFNVINTGSEDLNDVTVKVTLASTSPYRKTLTGEFILHRINNDIGSVDMKFNNDNYSNNLVISNSNNSTKCMILTWNSSNLHIDVDKTSLSSYANDDNGFINKIKFNINAKSSINYKFYNTDFTTTYDVTQFTLNESSDC